MSRIRLNPRRRPHRGKARLIRCLLQTREGKGLIMLLPSPLAGRAVIEAADGTQRAFDLIDNEGEEATYQEVEG